MDFPLMRSKASCSPSSHTTQPYPPELETDSRAGFSFPLNDPRTSSSTHSASQNGFFHPQFLLDHTNSSLVAERGSFVFTTHETPTPMYRSPWNNSFLGYSDPLISPSVPGPSEPIVYAAVNACSDNAIATNSQFILFHEQDHKVQGVSSPMTTSALASGNATPHPAHVVSWFDVCRNAVITNGRQIVPQIIYQPQSQGDKERYVSLATLSPPIIFRTGLSEWGIPLRDLLSKQLVQLVDGNDPAFTLCGPSIGVRVQWPGYQPYHKQVPTRDFTYQRRIISKAKLAQVIAKCVKQYMDCMSQQVMEVGSDGRWRVGPFGIGVDDVVLISLHHVSQGSWQPQLCLCRTIANPSVPTGQPAIVGLDTRISSWAPST